MKRNEVRRNIPAMATIDGKRRFVWPEYLAYVAGFAGSHRNADGSFQDLWACSDDTGAWHYLTPRQLRRTDTQKCQDILVTVAARNCEAAQ
jgi:hypothetical protein